MKSKNALYIVGLLAMFALPTQAQEIDKAIAEAKAAYSSKNLEGTRFALENALREINIALGKQVLDLMPTTLGSLSADPTSDDVSGMAVMFSGLNVQRSYTSESANAELLLMSDSPLLAGINSILGLPAMMLNSDKQKVVKIDGYKALMQKDEEGNGYSLQVPYNNSLVSLNYNGAISETDFTKIANTLPLAAMFKLAQ